MTTTYGISIYLSHLSLLLGSCYSIIYTNCYNLIYPGYRNSSCSTSNFSSEISANVRPRSNGYVAQVSAGGRGPWVAMKSWGFNAWRKGSLAVKPCLGYVCLHFVRLWLMIFVHHMYIMIRFRWTIDIIRYIYIYITILLHSRGIRKWCQTGHQMTGSARPFGPDIYNQCLKSWGHIKKGHESHIPIPSDNHEPV